MKKDYYEDISCKKLNQLINKKESFEQCIWFAFLRQSFGENREEIKKTFSENKLQNLKKTQEKVLKRAESLMNYLNSEAFRTFKNHS